MVKLVVVCLLALVLSISSVKAQDCTSVLAGLFPCRNYLSNFVPVTPGLQCCDSAMSVVSSTNIDSLCQCLRQNPLSSGFLPSKAQQLPNLCNLTSFLPLVNCLIPSSSDVPQAITLPPLSLLPPLLPDSPLIPLPPLLPSTPLLPLPPLIPFPPLLPGSPMIPLPPLIPLPPINPVIAAPSPA